MNKAFDHPRVMRILRVACDAAPGHNDVQRAPGPAATPRTDLARPMRTWSAPASRIDTRPACRTQVCGTRHPACENEPTGGGRLAALCAGSRVPPSGDACRTPCATN